MNNFSYLVTETALDDIAKLDPVTKKRIGKKLQYFVESGRPLSFATQIVNIHPPIYRFRVGKYRIFFSIKGAVLSILAVDRRDQAYKNINY